MNARCSIFSITVMLGMLAVSDQQLHGQTVLAQSQITTKNLNNIRFADQFSGTDVGAKINAATADLPSTGGTVDVRAFEGDQSNNTNVTIPANVTVMFGAITLSGTGRFLVNNDSAIIGMGPDTTKFNYTGSSSWLAPQTTTSLTRRVKVNGDVTSSTISNPLSGQRVILLLCQDGTGSRTMTWPTNVKLAGGAYTLTTTANKCDSLTAAYDGSNWYEVSRATNM